MICNKVQSNDSLKPRKLKQHLHNVHQQHKDKSRGFFERHATVLKKMRLDSSGTYHETNKNEIEASYHVALEIAKQKKPHTIGENLIQPCSLKIVELMLGKEEKKKIAAVSLSNRTIQIRIEDMAADVKDQVVQEIKSAAFGLFSIQLDESTDVASCSRLMVFVKYVHLNRFKRSSFFVPVSKKLRKPSTFLKKFLFSLNQKIFCGKTYMGIAQTEPQLRYEPNLDFKLMLKSKIQTQKAFIV